VVRLGKQLRVFIPNAPNICLKLLLAGAYPGRIMPFGYLDALVTEQNRNSLEWHSSQQQIHRKGVAKAVWVAILNLG
jgi:hypothetical protein